jgi:hypothetical protein
MLIVSDVATLILSDAQHQVRDADMLTTVTRQETV